MEKPDTGQIYFSSPSLTKKSFITLTLDVWTNFSQQDETWAEFSILEEAVCISFSYIILKQNFLT